MHLRARLIVTTIVAGGLALAIGGTMALAGKPSAPDTSKYPDLRTVVPDHLNFVNQQQKELLRFSNGIANTGPGPWALTPDPPIGTADFTNAVQEIRSSNDKYRCGQQPKPSDPCYDILRTQIVSSFEYHPTHNHWHTAGVARFEVRKGSLTGAVVGQTPKIGFCLIDLYNLDGNAPTSQKVFWDCYTSTQGIQSNWVDQYHQATDGQEVELTGQPNGTYYLVSTTNPTGAFLEQSTTNNSAWVRFTLSSDSNGNRKVTVTGHSPCESPGLCGENSPNR
jgi:hypothetical protein